MKKAIIFLVIFILLFASAASAEVVTTFKTEGYGGYIYVAGSDNNYPVEYYDEDLKAYCGVFPDILREISKHSGLDFVYINGDKRNKNTLGENLQVDIVSSVKEGELPKGGKEFIEIMSYDNNGKTVKYGIVCTSIMEESKISAIKTAIGKISGDKKSGIYLSFASREKKPDYILIAGVAVLVLFLTTLLILQLVRIKRIRRENNFDKLTDPETGMGNLQFFKYHFKYTIGDEARALYHIAYIIIDSSYLRSYHGDSSFEDVLKFTATVLSENTGDREISARITENGFAFAFQSTNDEDAVKRLEEIMKKLNGFENMKEKNNKLVFHCAAYHLLASDKNCEILLFNLRKNCNYIFGTDKQMILCDIHAMNMVQEEKKITESILKGFENNEFKIYLQFTVDNKTKKIVAAEALSRWDSSEKGLVSPNKYIRNMEIAGLIAKHDFYMFELVCRQLEKWSGTKYGSITISCNFTRITLSENNFADKIKMIARSYSFDYSRLAIEITEDAMEKDSETATKNVQLCKEMGFKVYLDDLGSGYTSLANLCDYPIDIVKIDRGILLKTDSLQGKALFGGIISLAHSLNMKVICEGVETEEQNTLVGQSDCDFIQGWYYSKALPTQECEAFMENYKIQ